MIYKFDCSSKKNIESIITRVVFNFDLTFAFRPAEIYSLKLRHVRFAEIDGKKFFELLVELLKESVSQNTGKGELKMQPGSHQLLLFGVTNNKMDLFGFFNM